MTPFFVDTSVSAALDIVVKASLLLAIAAVIHVVSRRRASASTRHLMLTVAMASALLLPLASFVSPRWDVVIRTAPPVAEAPPSEQRGDEVMNIAPAPASLAVSRQAEPTPAVFSWSFAAVSAYLAGAFAMLLLWIAQQWKMRHVSRRARLVADESWVRVFSEDAVHMGVGREVRLLCSREHNVPFVFGIRRAFIVMPLIAETWTEERRRAVIRHELAHIARHDTVTQMLAFAACTLYWFHPAAWWIARRLRIEAELACDDRVIAAGTEAREYAGHLLEIAYSLGGSRAPALAIAMARPRQLEGRMLAALDFTRSRRTPGRAVRIAAAAVAAVVMGGIAGARPVTATATTIRFGDVAPEIVVEAGEVETREKAGETTQDAPGTWEIRPSRSEGTVHLRLVETNSSSGSNVPIAQLEGLTAEQLAGAGGPIQFRMRRDAGTFTFEGVIRRGVGAGTFSFTADANFPGELAKRGFARPTAGEQYQLARHDIGYAFVDELNRQKYAKPTTAELVRAGQHGVNTTYLRDMGALGYRLGSLDPLITLRDHGVTPDYVRALADLGYKGLAADAIRQARDHGVSAEYVRAMREAGYGSLPMEALINARDHGVSPEFVRGLADAGYKGLPLNELIRVRDHGVSPEYVRELRQLGHNLGIAEFVNARDHGVSVEYVRELGTLGYGKLPMTSLVRARDHGVSVEYVRALKALGYDQLSIDDLITLRDHGLTAERIKAANARAGTRLPIDLLKALASGGGVR
jgi:beta-lactamase regulating signal transducer with metallopeptidase domain